MNFPLPKTVEYIISTIEAAGYRADVVGGSVRDFLLGKTPSDYDITTDATPKITKEIFCRQRTIDTGIKHGTVGLFLDGEVYEITTHRVDGEYKDSRHPESVSFTTDINEDLARRDFTVNAMAYSPRFGITDPFGGREDLENQIIRAVGDPYQRFTEDALRILRAVRFSSVLGFEIEEETARALRDKAELLKNVSPERIWVELKKTFMGRGAHRSISEFSDVLCSVIPSLDRMILPDGERFASSDFEERFLSVFALSSDDPASAFDSACRYLRTEKHIRDFGAKVLSSLGKYDLYSRVESTHMLRDLGHHWGLVLVKLEILLGQDKDILSSYTKLINSSPCYDISKLEVNGNDILALGASGRRVGEILNRLLCAVIDEECVNNRKRLLEYAERLIDKQN